MSLQDIAGEQRGDAPTLSCLAPVREVAPIALPAGIDFQTYWDEAFADLPNEVPTARTLTMASLARHGSWGNTILQYVFLRLFCRVHRFEYQTPNWIGRQVFGLADADLSFRPSCILADGFSTHCTVFGRGASFDPALLRASHVSARTRQSYLLLTDSTLRGSSINWPFQHAELEGLFFAQGPELAPHRDFIRELLRPVAPIQQRISAAMAKLRAGAGTVVGIHVRRNEFLSVGLKQSFELLTPGRAYLRWLDEIWPRLDRPRLLVCTDSPDIVLPEFARYKPVTPADLGCDLTGLAVSEPRGAARSSHGLFNQLSFLPDWLLLAECDCLAGSNSTYYFSACLLNQRTDVFYRPSFADKELRPFDPWQSDPILFLPPAPSLPRHMARRLRYTIHGLRGLPRRYLWQSVREIVRSYFATIKWRAFTSYLCGGRGGLARELLSPGFYIDLERRYNPPAPNMPSPRSLRRRGVGATSRR
jgi:hypothetical protein